MIQLTLFILYFVYKNTSNNFLNLFISIYIVVVFAFTSNKNTPPQIKTYIYIYLFNLLGAKLLIIENS